MPMVLVVCHHLWDPKMAVIMVVVVEGLRNCDGNCEGSQPTYVY